MVFVYSDFCSFWQRSDFNSLLVADKNLLYILKNEFIHCKCGWQKNVYLAHNMYEHLSHWCMYFSFKIYMQYAIQLGVVNNVVYIWQDCWYGASLYICLSIDKQIYRSLSECAVLSILHVVEIRHRWQSGHNFPFEWMQ